MVRLDTGTAVPWAKCSHQRADMLQAFKHDYNILFIGISLLRINTKWATAVADGDRYSVMNLNTGHSVDLMLQPNTDD